MIELNDMKLLRRFVNTDDAMKFYNSLDDKQKEKLWELIFRFPSDCLAIIYSTIISDFLDLDFDEAVQFADIDKGIQSIMYLPEEQISFILAVAKNIFKIELIKMFGEIVDGNN